MNAIENTLNIVKNVCNSAEKYIKNYLEKLDEDPNYTDTLTIPDLSTKVGEEVGIDYQQCDRIIYLYLEHRADLQIRPGRGGGIGRKGEPQRSHPKMSPEECALKHYDIIKEKASIMLDTKFKEFPNKKVNIRDLSDELENQTGIKAYAAYHCIKNYIDKERRDLRISKGRSGGVEQVK